MTSNASPTAARTADKRATSSAMDGLPTLTLQPLNPFAVAAKANGFKGCKVKVGKPSIAEDVARLSAVRAAVGDAFEVMGGANQAFTVAEARRRAHAYEQIGRASW